MRLFYLKNNRKYVAKANNQDVEFDFRVVDNRTTVVAKALTDITLVKADDIVPFNANFQDLYFLNGYQSWTDTKEYKLAKHLKNIKRSPHLITHMFAMDKYGDSSFYRYSPRKSHARYSFPSHQSKSYRSPL